MELLDEETARLTTLSTPLGAANTTAFMLATQEKNSLTDFQNIATTLRTAHKTPSWLSTFRPGNIGGNPHPGGEKLPYDFFERFLVGDEENQR